MLPIVLQDGIVANSQILIPKDPADTNAAGMDWDFVP